ncbi:hypothetical protein [Lutimonas sp.]|uniref:hypothetical protein n=1 Tax=Lutimonas sp. TaxID=1872403 RepID=UPI003C775D16
MHRILVNSETHKVLGWVIPPETFTDRTSVTERTWTYSQRVSGGITHAETSRKNHLDTPCDPKSLPITIPYALSRHTKSLIHRMNPHWITR